MKKKKTGLNEVKLTNSMAQLVSGVIPGGGTKKGSVSPNKINDTSTLALQVRGEFITLNYTLLSRLYQQFGLVQALIEVPVVDAFRGGVKFTGYEKKVVVPEKKKKQRFSFWNAEEKAAGNNEQVDFDIEQQKKRDEWEQDNRKIDDKLKKEADEYFRQAINGEEIRRMEIYLRRAEVWGKLQQAVFWKRLYGGSGIVIMDGRDPATPLNLEDINEKTELEFYVTDCWELSGSDPNVTDLATIDWLSDTPFSIRGHKIHKSRVIPLKGKEFPPLYRPMGRGWGMSILEPLVRTLNKGVKNENVIFELLDEAKIDIFSFYGLNDALQDEQATDAITKRVGYASLVKNYMKALLLDSEDVYQQKQIHFNGLADLKVDSRVDMAADARITMNKLYGTSPAGFNSGEADRETYADTVEAEVRIPTEAAMIRLLEIVGRKVLGKTLDFDIEWNSLIRTSEYEVEKMKTLKLANLNEANIFGRITNKEWVDAVNKHNLLGFEVSDKDKFVADPMAKQVFKPGFGR
jgi:phage-related protein (TIGR01555 family)